MSQKQSQSMRRESSHINNGFSLIEVILSTAVFALIVVALSGAYLYGEESTMLAGNRARAIMLAEEGVEAARNIRDASYTNLVDGTYGLATTSNQYNLAGTSDTNGFFTRAINIATVDAKRKDITSTVTWQQNNQRTGSVSMVSRLTNWLALGVSTFKSLIIYGDGTTMPKTRSYDGALNSFSTESLTATSSSGTTFILRTSPNHTEAIAGFVTATGVLNVMCYDGSAWTQEWSATVGGNGSTRRFDISYETNSGDVVVLYSTNTAAANELAYRTKLGSSLCGSGNWTGATNISSARTSGIVQWVKMAWDRRANSNLITAIWADANSDLSAMVWDGSIWANEPLFPLATSLQVVATSQDVEDFDVEYESLSGDVMVVWGITVGNNNNGVNYNVCTGGIAACTWGPILAPPTFSDDATNLDISANPNTDEIVFASVGRNQSDLQIGYWNGAAWTNRANVDTSAQIPVAGSKLVSTGWLISGATTRSIIIYNDSGSTNIGYYTGNASVFSVAADFTPAPVFTNPQKFYQVEMNPLSSDQLMFCLSDNANDLFCKRLAMSSVPAFTWTNSDGSALELTLPTGNGPFSFAFLRN